MRIVIFLLLLLLYAGLAPADEMRIRRIHIQNFGVFDPTLPEFDAWYYRWANRLHVPTRKTFIRRELLFRERDLLDGERVHESERNLRRNAFLSSALIEILPVSSTESDILVRTEDQWTLELNVSYGTSAGSRTYDFGFEDVNFLGWGRRVGIKTEKNEERTSWMAKFTEPRLLRSHVRLDARYLDSSDGHDNELSVDLPFVSEWSRWSFRVRGQDLRKDEHLYFDGTDVAIQELNLFNSSWHLQHAWGRPYRRTFAGALLTYDEKIYTDAVILEPDLADEDEIRQNLYPSDRRFIQYGATAGISHQEYVEMSYMDYYGAVEDLPDGWLANGAVLRAENAEAANYFTFILGARRAGPLGSNGYMVLYADGGIRNEAGTWNNKILNTGVKIYRQFGPANYRVFNSPRQTFAASFAATVTSGVDSPFQLSLGEDEGLRGYNFKSFVGSSKVLLNVEHRIFTSLENRMLGLALVPFFDAGATGRGAENWSGGTSVGIGFRLGIKKLRRNHIVRLDLAWPLINSPDKRFSISFATGQIFRVL